MSTATIPDLPYINLKRSLRPLYRNPAPLRRSYRTARKPPYRKPQVPFKKALQDSKLLQSQTVKTVVFFFSDLFPKKDGFYGTSTLNLGPASMSPITKASDPKFEGLRPKVRDEGPETAL